MEGALRQGADDPDLRLIETLRWDGTGFPRLGRHIARLARSAARLGWPCDPMQAERALHGAVGAGPARVRLLMNARSAFEVTATPLPPVAAVWRVALAPARLAAADPWLRLKSTRRAVYDAARAALPDGVDEVVFLNGRGEVCDGTITTVFFDRGQGMRTPPLNAGLLPGVLREELLAKGGCAEEPLPARDLPQVRLWLGNSLRGLIPAVWVG